MELYYLCIQFGFEGRYRLAARDTELNQMRDELFHIIRDAWGALPFELSPAWKGVTALNPQVRPFKNLWYWGLLLTLLLGALYLILSNFLHRKTEIAVQDVNNIMTAPAIVAEQAGVSPESPASAVIPQKPDVDVIKDLSNWQNSGQIKITKDNNKFIIATTKELFASASTNLRDPYPQLIEDVAKVLNKLPGKIEVIGHTDNVPIHTAKYADNMALSVARAQAVANLIANSLSASSRISSKGMGATDPTEPNTTAEGRLANRRVDIILTTP
jgi:type VI secretion system protein ImpK